jgi:hypothetical protein
MDEVVVNELMHDGMRHLKVISERDDDFERYLKVVPRPACDMHQMVIKPDLALGIFTMDLTWPVYEPFDVQVHSPKGFRRLMMVHFSYGKRVTEVISLAAHLFFAGTGIPSKYAFVRETPRDAEDGIMVHGLSLVLSEIVPAKTVGVGGMEWEGDSNV